MGHAPTCPRCGAALRPPGLWSSAWECAEHGAVAPFHVLQHPSAEGLAHVTRQARVPVWRPSGVGSEWECCGLGYAGDDRGGASASVVVARGPDPVGGQAEVLLVAEEPGVGLGARLAGLPEIDPGERVTAGPPPDGRILAARHPTALWPVEVSDAGDERAVFVGEAKGMWLWLVVWPASAGLLVYDGLELVDHRDDAGAAVSFADVTSWRLGGG